MTADLTKDLVPSHASEEEDEDAFGDLPADELDNADEGQGDTEEKDVLPWHAEPDVQPVLPDWVRDPDERDHAWRWALWRAWHETRFQTVRLPLYAGKTLYYAPRGAARLVCAWADWAFDAEGRPLRNHSVERGQHGEYLALSMQRDGRVGHRGKISLGIAAGAVLAAGEATYLWPPTPYPLLITALVLLGYVGRRPDRPFIQRAMLPEDVFVLTPEVVVRAFIAAKLCTEDEPIEFRAPGVHRDGDGWACSIDLPFGKKAQDAIKVLDDLAAGLDVDEAQVFLERVRGDQGSARRISLWVATRDPYATKPPLTPLAETEKLSLWRPFPFGIDARGDLVTLPLIWSAMLIGSIPRQGKTVAMRTVAAAAALDPYVQCIFADGKGGKDFKPFQTLAYWYGSGVRRAVVAAYVTLLHDLVAEMNRRYDVLADLPDDLCPEGKLTEAISRNKQLKMPLIFMFIDEIQRYLQHREFGKEIVELLAELAKVGPAAGIHIVVATQRPDAKVIPDDLRGQFSIRFALKTMSYQASNVILGPSASSAGLDASKLMRQHKGVGILLGSDDGELAERGAQRVRTHLHDLAVIRRIAERGRALREDAGTLTGYAAGEQVIEETTVSTLLDDCLTVFQPGEDRLWSETICVRLAERNPDVYDGWEPTSLANSLNVYGVDTRQLDMRDPETGKRHNRRGVDRDALLEAKSLRASRA